jgi:RNA polymerase sigma-B factor
MRCDTFFMETLSMQKVSQLRLASRPAFGTVRDLAELDDNELLAIVRAESPSCDRSVGARELLVSRYRDLVWSCVRRYRNSPEPLDDLMQVGYLGLIKAINNFNPAKGKILAAYAQACVTGELKRHFRDKRWQVHVERSVQERLLEVRAASRQLAQQLGHQPAAADLASHLRITTKELAAARGAEVARQTCSLDAQLADRTGGSSLAELLGADDARVEQILDLHAVASHWHELPRRERRILVMRFYGDMTQAEIGKQLGISQMQVSRLLAHALGYLRQRLLTEAA